MGERSRRPMFYGELKRGDTVLHPRETWPVETSSRPIEMIVGVNEHEMIDTLQIAEVIPPRGKPFFDVLSQSKGRLIPIPAGAKVYTGTIEKARCYMPTEEEADFGLMLALLFPPGR